MKDKILKFKKAFIALAIALTLTLTLNMGVWAEEGEIPQIDTQSGEYVEVLPEDYPQGGEVLDNSPNNVIPGRDYDSNIFDEIYGIMETNADKIFSILAFIGTLVVGIGYKSGLLPLLRDALSKLKYAIDGVKADGELSKALTENKMNEICQVVSSNNCKLLAIEERLEGYESLQKERQTMQVILAGQIDMLYAIFMSSALPQYQKDEIGERIKAMREELASYENVEE